MELSSIQTAIIFVITTLGSLFVGGKLRFFQEKKADADALASMRDTYSDFVSDHKAHYEELKNLLSNIKTELDITKKESLTFQFKIKDLESLNLTLELSIEVWKKKYDDMCDKLDKITKAR